MRDTDLMLGTESGGPRDEGQLREEVQERLSYLEEQRAERGIQAVERESSRLMEEDDFQELELGGQEEIDVPSCESLITTGGQGSWVRGAPNGQSRWSGSSRMAGGWWATGSGGGRSPRSHSRPRTQ